MKTYGRFLMMAVLMITCLSVFSQKKEDSVVVKNGVVVADTSIKKISPAAQDSVKKERVYVPRTAAIRSAILPGLGQIYNRKYWKLPIVYGALGTTALVFRFNIKGYNRIRFAYNILVAKDSARFKEVDADLQPYITYNALGDLRAIRNEYRKNIDYSVLVFMLFWALNIVDATVDAHLKGFDVTSDLSMKIKPDLNSGGRYPGLSFVFDLHKPKTRLLALP
ncbi:MAG: hypothetical protein INR73_04495 [Williamsia sp.]|nr:hypothetical protein [Williamsia sp.]